jgi:hypothetical protein
MVDSGMGLIGSDGDSVAWKVNITLGTII